MTDPNRSIHYSCQNCRRQRFDKLEALRKASWDSIESRRKYEWMASIAFWTLQASAIAIIVKNDFNPHVLLAFICSAGAVSCIVAHASWLQGLFDAYSLDKKEESALREAMRNAAGYVESTDITERRKTLVKQREEGFQHNWNHLPQLWMTILLSVSLIVLIACRIQ